MTDERIIAYLLEELPEEELESFEEECFAQESWPDRLASVEGDLIDEYLRKELAPPQRQSFEQNYLVTDARLERVRMAAALLRHLDAQPDAAGELANEKFDAGEAVGAKAVSVRPDGPTWAERLRGFWGGQSWGLRTAFAFALLAVVSVGAWRLAGTRPSSGGAVATLFLSAASATRAEGAEATNLKLAPGMDAVRVSLALPGVAEPASGYRVELEDMAGGTIKTFQAESWDARSVSVRIPAASLSRGLHALRLSALKPGGGERRITGSYYFNVE